MSKCILNINKVSIKEQELLFETKNIAHRSVSPNGHKVGCIIVCSDGSKFQGATVARTRAIGSTCAERMALDQWYFGDSVNKPVACYIVATFKRQSWTNDLICTPCGVCLEMFLELIIQLGTSNIEFNCANWDLNKVLKADLKDFFPQFGKNGWPYTQNIGIR